MLQGRKGEGPASWLQASFPSFLGWTDLPDMGWWSPWLRKIDLYLGFPTSLLIFQKELLPLLLISTNGITICAAFSLFAPLNFFLTHLCPDLGLGGG